MSATRVIYQLARADFFERIRRFSFAVTLVATIIVAYIFVPANGASYTTLDIGGHRGVYNSAWIGAQVSMLTSVFLVLIGFYLVRNAVGRDRTTRVGQIIAATPVPKSIYTLGKWLSNCMVLGLIGGVVLLGAAALQLIRGEDMVLRPLSLIAPFISLLLPAVALVSAIAVLFECIPFLSGALGNIIYFFIFPQMLMSEMLGGPKILGVSYFIDGMKTACRAVYPNYVDAVSFGINFHGGRIPNPETFVWNGMPVSFAFLQSRAFWLVVAIGIAAVAAIPFDRFDTSRSRKRSHRVERPPRFARIRGWLGGSGGWSIAGADAALAPGIPVSHVHLTPLAGGPSRGRFGGILAANLRLALRAMPWWWHVGALGLIVCELFVPWEGVQKFVLPGALIWPVAIWAALGNREIRHATHQIVFSAAHPLRRQLSAAWLTGLMTAMALVIGAGVRWLLMGDWDHVAALLVGTAFVPSLALALGAWSRTSRLFEVIYLFWWYIGPLNAVPGLDYAGISQFGGTPGVTVIYALTAVGLLALGFLGGHRQLEM